MLKQLTKRMRNRTVVTIAILSLMGHNVHAGDGDQGGSDGNGKKTKSPIKHVIIIVGENRTFDHLFATYKAPSGESVDNLLSKGIIREDGSPGPNYARAQQYSATDTAPTLYQINPGGKVAYGTTSNPVQAPGTSYAPQTCYTSLYALDSTGAAVNGPGCVANIGLAQGAELVAKEPGLYSLETPDLGLLLTGATGLSSSWPDSRIKNYNNLPGGPYPLTTASGASLYDTYGGSPVHRFYQMWQELDCDATKATHRNPSGCQADLFPWVEITVSSGSNGSAPKPPPPPAPLLKEGNVAMGFFNVANGDVPYLTKLAREYTLLDNYHQPFMGGTFADMMMFGYADALYYANANGDPDTPPLNQIENPNPMPNATNNWYTQDGYGGGSYTNCSEPTQPAVSVITNYLKATHVPPNCRPGAYYLLNNYVPAYIGSGKTDPTNNGPFTLPPVIKQRHVGDVLSAANVSWAFYGERWADFQGAPGLGANFGYIDPPAYLYCNICNPFLYSKSTMTSAAGRAHLQDVDALYNSIADGTLPAVSWVKPSTFNDGHPASSKVDIFEAFTKNIIDKVQANKDLWDSTAVLVTVDEGGGYYDSGYVQLLDYFGDGTRIPMIIVSKYTTGGHVSHEYADHASTVKFIERNWNLPKLTSYSRDNLPNPKTSDDNPYVPQNRPALGDLFQSFAFGSQDQGDQGNQNGD